MVPKYTLKYKCYYEFGSDDSSMTIKEKFIAVIQYIDNMMTEEMKETVLLCYADSDTSHMENLVHYALDNNGYMVKLHSLFYD